MSDQLRAELSRLLESALPADLLDTPPEPGELAGTIIAELLYCEARTDGPGYRMVTRWYGSDHVF